MCPHHRCASRVGDLRRSFDQLRPLRCECGYLSGRVTGCGRPTDACAGRKKFTPIQLCRLSLAARMRLSSTIPKGLHPELEDKRGRGQINKSVEASRVIQARVVWGEVIQHLRQVAQ